jgi:hypothetical protein
MSGQKETGKANGPKKGFWAILKESIAKSNDGCGPGCGCRAADDKKAMCREGEGEGKKK